MKLLVVGFSHQTAPLNLRERIDIVPERLEDALGVLGARLGNGVILSTCNRLEVYGLVPSPFRGAETIKRFLTSYHGVSRRQIELHHYVYTQRDAVQHLFRVACGLNSLIIGEPQILGQVRAAYSKAASMEMTKGTLSRMFHQAIRTGKRSRKETDIGRNAFSVSKAAVETAKNLIGDLRGKKILVIGVGEAGKLAARALKDAGAANIFVTNRTYERAISLAKDLDGQPIVFKDFKRVLRDVDVVVSATGSPEYIVTFDLITRMRSDHKKPLFFIDIAVPRDIDPRVGELPNVYLHNIDSLETLAENNRRYRQKEVYKVEKIVTQEVDRFMEWLFSLEVVPTVTALRDRAEYLRVVELYRAMKKLPNLTVEEKDNVDAFSRAVVNKLLHEPITLLKERLDPLYTQSVRDLFDLDKDDVP